MAPAYVTREEESKRPYGLVKQHLDVQREVNKRRSKALHLLNVSQVWFEDGAFEDESKARSEAARPDGWIRYRPQMKVERVTHEQFAQAQFDLLAESKKEIDESGINRELQGDSRAQSGREFQLRLKEGLKSIREIMTNIRAARRRVAEYWLDDILEDMKREAEKTGVPLAVRKYDVVIEEAAESVNLQSETFDSLAKLVEGGLPIPSDIIIQVSPLPPKVKSDILARMKAAEQQQAAEAAAGVPPRPTPHGGKPRKPPQVTQ
jgi:hypothetical protein